MAVRDRGSTGWFVLSPTTSSLSTEVLESALIRTDDLVLVVWSGLVSLDEMDARWSTDIYPCPPR